MRIIHTSDWHLGHQLHQVHREYEHDRFLSWLLTALVEKQVDALLIAGDIFDSSNPPVSAQKQLFRFLAQAREKLPAHFQVVLIGGNHDSAARLDAPRELLQAMRVNVIGGVPRRADGAVDAAAMAVPLRGKSGEIEAWCAAMPFIRVSDISIKSVQAEPREDDPLVEGVRALYKTLLDHVFSARTAGQAVVATGHCYMVGSQVSELSERKILGGNQHALPADIFPEELAYAALGHLHRSQAVGGKAWIRYCGSPIPLSFAEAGYKHGVCLLELKGEKLVSTEDLPIPRVVPMIRLPALEPLELFERLAHLPDASEDQREEERPFLELTVSLSAPLPGLRRKIEAALEGKAPRLLKLAVVYRGDGAALADRVYARTLKDMQVGEVFADCYRKSYDGEPPGELSSMFHELVEAVEGERI